MEQASATTMAGAQVTTCVVAGLENFDALVSAEQRRIYRVLLAMLRDPDAADSLTQDCFLKAYEHRERFRGECSVRTWLLRIAINLARDYGKSRRWQFWRKLSNESGDGGELVEAADPQPSPERSLLLREQLAEVGSALAELPTQQRAVFALRFVEEMSIEEIAQATSLRPGTVKSHLFRATAAIRERVKERGNK